MKHTYQTLMLALFSGILVGIGGILYVSSSNKIIGGVLFSFALLLIVSRGYYLFTGKVGYLLPYKKGNLKLIGLTLLGNTVGISLISALFLLSGKNNALLNAQYIFAGKLAQSWLETLVLAIFCGFMMYLAVDSYDKIKNQIASVFVVIFAVVIFIVAGFEHSIADMSYLVLSKTFTFESLLFIGIVIIGNLIGAVALNLLQEQVKKALK
ncbi:formate/nitrite transporter family protein [Mariniplasma anaerobium]|uniref:Transporter n=1 Tax=Mariniplasma anaerobium TaxID=2735436 RepID=A0A7U9TI84_9MOLU|nr:formate/nitrite transporter family protein [Mariniplasma anaerobium]BCR35414.1 transporter [Mariniplasma anaerobium]